MGDYNQSYYDELDRLSKEDVIEYEPTLDELNYVEIIHTNELESIVEWTEEDESNLKQLKFQMKLQGATILIGLILWAVFGLWGWTLGVAIGLAFVLPIELIPSWTTVKKIVKHPWLLKN